MFDDELRRFQFQRRQFDIDGALKIGGGALPRCRQALCRLVVIGRSSRRRFAKLRQAGFAGFELREIVAELFAKRRQRIDRDAIFAARGAQGEQTLLDALQLARIIAGGA